MKVLFIYPNAGSQLGFNYGLAHMSAVLKRAGHQVHCLQLCEDLSPLPTREEFIAALKQAAPGVVGFSVVTNQWKYAAQLAQWARQALSCPLVCGGIHATVATEDVLQSGLFDYVFLGECEEAFLEFVGRIERKEPVDELPNLACMRQGQMLINPVRPLPKLQDMPLKDYGIFDFQKMIDAKNGWVGLMASRGCPFSCSYCFNHLMVRKYMLDLQCSARELDYVRHFPVERVLEEVAFLLGRYRNISTFIFDDDLFTFDKDYVLRFCRLYPEVSKLPLVVNAHVGFFDEERASALAAANCRIVKFGIESGSEQIRRKILNRNMGNQAIVDAIALTQRHGMHSSVFVMIGLPYETPQDVMDTIDLLAKAKPGRFRWTFFFPYPNTKAHELSVEGGFIDHQRMESLTNFTDSSCLDFGAEQNLLLSKIGVIMPWFVNVRCEFEASGLYRTKVQEILAMDAAQWEMARQGLLEQDKQMSASLQEKGLRHYAIKYNPFMGVISDYFTRER